MRGTNIPQPAPAFAWAAALAFTTLAGTLAIGCMMPFAGLAAALAATATRGAMTLLAVWLGNQLLGFVLLGYPPTAYTFGWGGALLGASLAAMAVARRVTGDGRDLVATHLIAAFAAAFGTYEALLFVFASLAGGLETFVPAVVARIALNDAIWFAGLVGLHSALTRAAPRWFGAARMLRFAS